MKAVRLTKIGQPLKIQDIPEAAPINAALDGLAHFAEGIRTVIVP
jgi:hypothetical protein